MPSYRLEIEAILAGARAEHRALLEHVSPALAASLPVDATGITQAIDALAEAAGHSSEAMHGEQLRAHRTNSAVLHGRVFGRAPLTPETVQAAFEDGARVRAGVLVALAGEVGGEALATEVRGLVDSPGGLQELYAGQERAAIRIAAHLDEME